MTSHAINDINALNIYYLSIFHVFINLINYWFFYYINKYCSRKFIICFAHAIELYINCILYLYSYNYVNDFKY